MAAPTNQELEVLKEFREEIKDLLPNFNEYRQSDAWLLRWLRARELDVGRANRMLRRSLEWREQEKVDDLLKWDAPNIVREEFWMKLSGFDNDGCPIGIVPFGEWDIRKVVEMKLKDTFVKYVDFLFEIALTIAERKSTEDKVITQFILIMDLERFSFRQIASRETIDAIFEAIKRFEANHPETLKAAYLVNAPRIFAYLFSFIKPLLTARTLDKVQIFGSSGSSWKPILLKTMAPSQLPSEMGGSNTTPTNSSIIKSDFKYTIQDLFAMLENPVMKNDEFPEAGMTPAQVDSGKKKYLDCNIDVAQSRLSWGFKVDKHDIGFALLSPCGDELVRVSRADANNNFVHEGTFVCRSTGVYQMVFDNSFSRFRSKQIRYSFKITKPELDTIK